MVSQILSILLAFSVCTACSSRTLAPSPSDPLMKNYDVHVDFRVYHDDCKLYQQLLEKVILGRSPKDALRYCFKEVSTGFSAKLTHEESEKLKGEEGIYAVVEEQIYNIDWMIKNIND